MVYTYMNTSHCVWYESNICVGNTDWVGKVTGNWNYIKGQVDVKRLVHECLGCRHLAWNPEPLSRSQTP
jgi:hypothetical protein